MKYSTSEALRSVTEEGIFNVSFSKWFYSCVTMERAVIRHIPACAVSRGRQQCDHYAMKEKREAERQQAAQRSAYLACRCSHIHGYRHLSRSTFPTALRCFALRRGPRMDHTRPATTLWLNWASIGSRGGTIIVYLLARCRTRIE